MKTNLAIGILKRIATLAISLILIAASLFVAAGKFDWIWAWVYLAICLISVSINAAIMQRTHLEMIAERGELRMAKNWDKIISGLTALVQYLVLPLVAGLDNRYGWAKSFGLTWHLAGAVIVALGLELTSWAMFTNAFFSTAVRIQDDRGQQVCSSGPYHYVRHPGYVGFILQCLGVPLLLGSWWGLIPGVGAVALISLRTAFEDRMLQAELPGYQDYAKEVRFRLFPGVW